jgi:hypothetical protein
VKYAYFTVPEIILEELRARSTNDNAFMNDDQISREVDGDCDQFYVGTHRSWI